ncbi:hypothetical protein [Pseudoduganella albidiflava]|nr:hypothetical protein [Pseudoduganella albidiflava]
MMMPSVRLARNAFSSAGRKTFHGAARRTDALADSIVAADSGKLPDRSITEGGRCAWPASRWNAPWRAIRRTSRSKVRV